MKAAWFETFGDPLSALRVGELDTPEPVDGEVLVRMHTSGVNPSDVKKRAGAFPNLLDDGLVIPHSDGAGVIETNRPNSPIVVPMSSIRSVTKDKDDVT